MASRRIEIVFRGMAGRPRRRRLERDVITAADRLDQLGAAVFIGGMPGPERGDALHKEFQKLAAALEQLRWMGAL